MGKIKQSHIEDKTKPWLKKFFECKKIAEEPKLNTIGLWKKPDHNDFTNPAGKTSK